MKNNQAEILSIIPASWYSYLENVRAALAGVVVYNPNKGNAPQSPDYDVIQVNGVLLPTVPESWRDFGIAATGYDEIEDQINTAMKNSKAAIVLAVDSPGGMVRGIDRVLGAISDAKKEKNVVAYVDGYAASAAYWIASHAASIYATRLSQVGNIGAFSVMYDFSAAYGKSGIEAVVARSGEQKGAGIEGAPITPEQREEQQRMVDSIASQFIGDVIKFREGVSATEISTARSWLADQALTLGLIDKVITTMPTVGEIMEKKEMANLEAKLKAAAEAEEEEKDKEEENAEKEEEEEEKSEGKEEEKEEEKKESKAVKSERKRVSDILAVFGDDSNFAAHHIKVGSTLEQAKLAHYEILRGSVAVAGVRPIQRSNSSVDASLASNDFIAAGNVRAKDKGISLHEACRQIAAERPDLFNEYKQRNNFA